jgi:4-carboxymuconolactone decarboxylase
MSGETPRRHETRRAAVSPRTAPALRRDSRSLERFAAAMATRKPLAAARALGAARAAGWPRAAAEETALMLVLHAGFPAALEGLGVLQRAWPGRARAGAAASPRQWRLRGERNCRRVYGRSFDRLMDNVKALHPDLAEWMVEQGYGRVLSRPRLDGLTRERVAVAVLAALGWERQLVSHLLGAVRFGATPAEAVASARLGARAGGAAVRPAFEAARRAAFAPRWRGSRSSG